MEYVRAPALQTLKAQPTHRGAKDLAITGTSTIRPAIPKFEEVKRLFPQHSEVDRVVQSAQQLKAEGKEKSSFPMWIVGVVVVVLFLLGC
jgi:hypothetical protein